VKQDHSFAQGVMLFDDYNYKQVNDIVFHLRNASAPSEENKSHDSQEEVVGDGSP